METAEEFAQSEEQKEVEFDGPASISTLEQHGINSGDIKKLQDSGFHTVQEVMYAPKKNLVTVKGLSEGKVEKIIDQIK